MADFGAAIGQAYATEGAVIDLGRGVHEGALAPEAVVRLPLATMNRHGLIAGATGTGKTKTLQLITEQLSAQGVPVFVADVKGDLSGPRRAGRGGRAGREAHGRARAAVLPDRLPGRVPLARRASGRACRCARRSRTSARSCSRRCSAPTRRRSPRSGSSSTTPTRRACRCWTSSDLRALLTYLDSKDGKAELEGIGGLSKATVGVLLRSLVGLETGGGTEFFGEPQLDIADLMRVAPDGRGRRSPASSCPPSRTGPGCSRP